MNGEWGGEKRKKKQKDTFKGSWGKLSTEEGENEGEGPNVKANFKSKSRPVQFSPGRARAIQGPSPRPVWHMGIGRAEQLEEGVGQENNLALKNSTDRFRQEMSLYL
jgi:hypothetical protein